MYKIILIPLAIISLCSTVAAHTEEINIAKKIEGAEIGFQKRWNEFVRKKPNFILWNPNWKEEELKTRFDKIFKERNELYFINPEVFGKEGEIPRWKDEYQPIKNWEIFHSRYNFPLTFLYTLAYPNYNASIISLQGIHFLAMEAPTDKNLATFFKVLDEYKVTDLVRVTPAVYQGREASVPYWEDRLNIHSITGRTALEVNRREIHYYPTDKWEDHQGIDYKKLLALVKAVKNSPVSDPKMIAVHCRAGVGRTGTFIAAYLIINEIDQQIASGVDPDQVKISIDKTIWELSLQRPLMLSHFPQYLTLHELVSYYIDLLQIRLTHLK